MVLAGGVTRPSATSAVARPAIVSPTSGRRGRCTLTPTGHQDGNKVSATSARGSPALSALSAPPTVAGGPGRSRSSAPRAGSRTAHSGGRDWFGGGVVPGRTGRPAAGALGVRPARAPASAAGSIDGGCPAARQFSAGCQAPKEKP